MRFAADNLTYICQCTKSCLDEAVIDKTSYFQKKKKNPQILYFRKNRNLKV